MRRQRRGSYPSKYAIHSRHENNIDHWIQDTLHIISEGILIKLLVPKWAVPFRKRFKEVMLGFDELEVHYKLPTREIRD